MDQREAQESISDDEASLDEAQIEGSSHFMGQQRMEESISNVNTKCYEVFNSLAKIVQNLPSQFDGQIKSDSVTELFDRYRLWAGNVGVGHTNQLSLDYRLREASWLKSQITEIMTRLHDNLERITQLLKGERIPFENRSASSKSLPTSPIDSDHYHDISDESSWEGSSSDDAELDACRNELMSKFSVKETDEPSGNHFDTLAHTVEGFDKEVPYLCQSVKLLIDHLYEIPIRKPAPMNRLIKHDNTSLFNKYVAPFDILYIRDLLKDVTLDAANRMGRLNTQRRRILEYRKRHYQNLQAEITPMVVTESSLENRILHERAQSATTGSVKSAGELDKATQTKATTFRELPKFGSLLSPPPSSAVSEVSRVSTHTAKDIPLQLPPQPIESTKGHGYICPYCFLLKQTMDEKSWEKHVLKDLQPYVCTFANCNLGEHFFNSEDDWYAHEARYHQCSWSCNVEGHGEYPLETDFLNHLHAEHDMEMTAQQLLVAGEAFRKSSKILVGLCHLCGSKTTNLKKHIARHLQRIACFVLPKPEVEPDLEFDKETSNKAIGFGMISSQNELYDADTFETGSKEHTNEKGSNEEPLHSSFNDGDKSLLQPDGIEEGLVIPDATEKWEECITKFSMARHDIGKSAPLQLRVQKNSPSSTTPPISDMLQETSSSDISKKTLAYEDYTAGWICTRGQDVSASLLMLDEHHNDLPCGDDADSYYLGNISGHNVVIACSVRIHVGETALAMQKRFPNCLRTPLAIGLGKGVPSARHDIRLGDVVVGVPMPRCSPVVRLLLDSTDATVQNDINFKIPTTILLNTAYMLATDSQLTDRMLSIVTTLGHSYPEFVDPGEKSDTFYTPGCEHQTGNSICEVCGQLEQIPRLPRMSAAPIVHYGTIASGNLVIQHGKLQDQLVQQHDILCFETDAADLVKLFPFLVIRGVYDYSNSQETESFRKYAALTAAVYAKILLSSIRVRQTVSGLEPRDQEITEKLGHRKIMMAALNFEFVESRQDMIKSAGTCEWIVKTPKFRKWFDRANSEDLSTLLLIKGKPGSGKSTIMKFLSAQLQTSNQVIAASYYFSTRGSQLERSSLGLWRSLVFQILSQAKDLQVVLDVLPPNTTFDTLNSNSVMDVFIQIIQRLKGRRLVCFVDALDECAKDEFYTIINYFISLYKLSRNTGAGLSVCISNRHGLHDYEVLGSVIELEMETGHRHAIERFTLSGLQHDSSSEANALTLAILEAANGVFLWAVIVVSLLPHDFKQSQVRSLAATIASLPRELDGLYLWIVSDKYPMVSEFILSLQWMLYAQRPLQLDDLYFGIICGNEDVNEMHARLLSNDNRRNLFISDLSRGLIECRQDSFVQFTHESIRTFLLYSHHLDKPHPLSILRIEGACHERIKACCARLLTTVYTEDPLGFPDYAIRYIFYHAEQAQAAGISQHDFLHSFPWHKWTKLYNKLQVHPDGLHLPGATDVALLLQELKLPHLHAVWVSPHEFQVS